MTAPDPITRPPKIDTSRPHPARMYDYFLGGKDNYPVDQEAAERFIAAAPEVKVAVRANRDFMRRAVRHVVGEGGIRQILDIGTGLPTEPNVHQIAREIAPETRVAYVDNDPIVGTHSMALLDDDEGISVVLADLREPRAILDHPDVRKVIDLNEPVALLLVAVLHFVKDEEDPAALMTTLLDALPAGSYLVLTHATVDFHEDRRADAVAVYKNASATMNPRPHAEVLTFFGDLTLLEPGLVTVPSWRPDAAPDPTLPPIGFYGGVARKDA
ncbi:SAM-dependent methyltransferase [Streptomyces roseirectus]|uniref:SAM-dependent methyltransferase n=1 Tax=Streptomyces roseirectus TaxID=2768066 RepID=A0A7H0I8A5_9ACTN|nr:SAM-dependent methyltransferase [Streptomyces roseirectus]QNP69021.1 SAM-dependent methyltransferase [Streptomyces roseirectus]